MPSGVTRFFDRCLSEEIDILGSPIKFYNSLPALYLSGLRVT